MEFQVPAEEMAVYEKWFKQHHTKHGSCKKAVKERGEFSAHGAIDGHLTWEFMWTGLGGIICVRCSCGERVNLTEKANWVNFG
jgi:hypothetical protein